MKTMAKSERTFVPTVPTAVWVERVLGCLAYDELARGYARTHREGRRQVPLAYACMRQLTLQPWMLPPPAAVVVAQPFRMLESLVALDVDPGATCRERMCALVTATAPRLIHLHWTVDNPVHQHHLASWMLDALELQAQNTGESPDASLADVSNSPMRRVVRFLRTQTLPRLESLVLVHRPDADELTTGVRYECSEWARWLARRSARGHAPLRRLACPWSLLQDARLIELALPALRTLHLVTDDDIGSCLAVLCAGGDGGGSGGGGGCSSKLRPSMSRPSCANGYSRLWTR